MPASGRWVVLLCAAACGPQVLLPDESSDTSSTTGTVTTTTSASTTSTSTTSTGPMTSTSGPVETTTGVDPDPTTGIDPDPTTGVVTSDSSSEGNDCPPDSECTEDADCRLQGICIACLCVGGCELEGSGTYGACLLADGNSDESVCRDDDAVCVIDVADMPTLGVCLLDCVDACDCPPFPGFDGQVMCEDITGEGTADCYLDCSRGQTCPDGMTCVAETICMWPPS